MPFRFSSALVWCSLLVLFGLGCAAGGERAGGDRRTAASGLVETEIAMPGILFVRDDHGIGSYDAFLIPAAGLRYRRGSSTLSEDFEQVFKAQLEQTLYDAAEKAEIPIVREPGACVMVVAIGLVEVDVKRRPSADPVGQLTVAMEFQDSLSGEPLLHYEVAQSVANDGSGDEPEEQIIRRFDQMVRDMQLAGALRAAGLADDRIRPECDGLLAERGRSLATPAVSAR